jgi:SAM-dependent methyltransferase
MLSSPLRLLRGLGRRARSLLRTGSYLVRGPLCTICASPTRLRRAYKRDFHQCSGCGFIFSLDFDAAEIDRGMGMEGSWSGPGGGGYREYFLVRMLMRDLGFRSFLLFGTGNTPTLGRLLDEGVDVVGCDISLDVVDHKKQTHGDETFFSPDSLPSHLLFDGIVAVEVFEHLTRPRHVLEQLSNKLRPGGVICGTTNFYPGGPVEDENDPGYMSHQGHVAYWSARSLSEAAAPFGLTLTAFEVVRPGSVLPDEKYGQLWPNKRAFFLFPAANHGAYFNSLAETTPILPIDQP